MLITYCLKCQANIFTSLKYVNISMLCVWNWEKSLFNSYADYFRVRVNNIGLVDKYSTRSSDCFSIAFNNDVWFLSACPPFCFRLIYLNNCQIDCHGTLCRDSCSPEDKSVRLWSSLTFPVVPPSGQSFHLSWEISQHQEDTVYWYDIL